MALKREPGAAALVAHIPAELHKRVRRAALERGITMRQFVIEALSDKLEEREVGEVDEAERDEIIRRLQERFAHIRPGVSLADELIAERREEARRKAEESALQVDVSDDGERRREALARARALFVQIPPGVSLADELIAERREEARREAAD